MELMSSCFDKLLKLIKQPIPEAVLGKLTFSVREIRRGNLEKTSLQTVTALNYLKEKHGIIHRGKWRR